MIVRLLMAFISRIFFIGMLLCPAIVFGQEPTVQPSSLAVSDLGSGSLTLSWTRGDGGFILVVARLTATGVQAPSDGTTNTANQFFGSGTEVGGATGNFVVFSGTGTSTTVRGLSASTAYTFEAYEFNTGGAPTPDYLTTGAATVSTTTDAGQNLYSFQSGNAETASTWTTDASGATLVNSAVPGSADHAIVLANRTVTVTENNFDVDEMEVQSSGILTLASTTGHDFITMSGTGRINSANAHPTVTNNDFATTSGGTFAYDTSGAFLTISTAGAATYNNLVLNDTRFIVGTDFTVNGTLTLETISLFRIGNSATPRSLSLNNIVVNGGNFFETSTISTGAATPHTATISGDVTNSGQIDFTSQSSAQLTADPTVGVVTVTFNGASDQTMTCNAISDFYRVIVDKGSGQSSKLTITASSSNNFRVFGRNDQVNTASGDAANPTIEKAIAIQNGTLELTGSVNLTSLTEGGEDYFIPANGALHINGASVAVTNSSNGTADQGINVVGKLQVSSGSINTGNAAGVTYAGGAEIDIDGGALVASQLRASGTTIGAVNSLSYNQSAGTVTINNGGTNSSSEARFDMAAANTTTSQNSFIMTGGSLVISGPNSDQGISIITTASDFSVTGGSITAEVTGSDNFGIAINGSLNDINMQRAAGSGDVRPRSDGPITMTELNIDGDLALLSGVTLDMDNLNLNLGGSFSISSGTFYVPGTNTTTFNGTGTQTFSNGGTITGNLESLVMNKSTGTLNMSGSFTVDALLTLTSGTMSVAGGVLTVVGNIVNSATQSGSGTVNLTGTSAQVISGDGTGSFQNVTLTNTDASAAPVSITANMTVNGTLSFANDKLFDIGSNLLTFGSSAGTSGVNSSRYIQTNGLATDAGVSRVYGGAGGFTWHIGTSTEYTPAAITVTSASSFGSINMIPVATEQPNVTTAGISLTYFWRVASTGFSALSSVTHSYQYDQTDVQGDEVDYVFGRYLASNTSWTTGAVAGVDESSNTIGGTGGLSAITFIDGDYTAGDTDPNTPFGAPTVFFSRNDAPNITTTGSDWDTDSGGSKTTWSTVSHAGAASSQLPEDVAGSVVVIASGHNVDVTTSTKSIGSLTVTGTLDLGTTTAHSFNSVSGTGIIRASSSAATASFPTGDYTAFNGSSGGTVVFYKTTIQDFTLPSSPTSYNNLIIETGTGTSSGEITLPAADLIIGNDFTITDGSGAATSGEVLVAPGNDFTVTNDLILTSENAQTANLTFQSAGTARAIAVTGNITVGTNNTIEVTSGNGLAHTLSIDGSVTNNGTFDLVPAAGTSVATTFSSASSTSVTGVGGTTEFGAVTINKGSDITSELNVNATAFSLESLTLTNGTFRLTSAQTITANTGSFTIPSTARLATSGGTINVSTGADDANDLLLVGELEVVSGAIAVGTAGNNNNNDIEYSSTGTPNIDVQGGTLTVNGQIRRGTGTTGGDLTYSQTAGTVNINGRNTTATRAKLEVANSGSFTMSAGTINIVRGGGTTFDDLYLQPGSSSVTGGTIVFTPGTAGNQTFNLSATITLPNITVTGNGGSNTASLTVNDQAITVDNLTISEANSTFDANGLDLNITGDFSNTGTFTSGSNTTTFNGTGAQAATFNGGTSFNNLIVNKSAETLTLGGSSDPSVTNDLTLTNGTMEDGGRTINVTGNVTNNATHTSGTIGTGGISFTDADHQITGAGVFGNITLTGTGRTVTVNGANTLNANLDFTGTVLFDILSNPLTFGSSATITGGTFGDTRMIRTSSNNTITKNFPASATDFTFQIGIGSSYTPVRTNLTANSATGSIAVGLFNVRHPLTTDAGNTELLRYWTLTSTGLATLTADLTFTYVDADIQGTEASYVGGTVVGGDWTPQGGTGGAVTAASNTISYSGVSTVTGEYTAGLTAEFGVVDTFFSRADGDWEDASTWSTISHVGAAAGTFPSGHTVDISSAHTVTVTANSASAFSVIQDGTLDLGTTIAHSFGTMTGTGTMQISATGGGNFTFPSADISGFTGTVEYTGATTGSLISTPSAFHNLSFSGASTKNLENASFTVNNDLSISAGTVSQVNAATIQIAGDFNQTGGTFTDTGGTVDFNGTTTQAINATGVSTTFNTFNISNSAAAVTINNAVNMNGAFTQSAGTTLDLDGNSIGGTGAVVVNGRVQTSNAAGFSGGASTSFSSTHSSVGLNAGSVIAYDGAAQTLSGRTDYDELEIGGSGTKTLDGNTTVAGSLNISVGELSIGANTLTMNGTITGVGTIIGSTTSNIAVGGTGALGTVDFSTGSETLGDLTINRSTSGTVTFEESFTVTSDVVLTNGIVSLAETTTMTVGATGVQGTITGGTDDIYFNTDPVDDDLDTNPDIDVFHEGTDITIPMGYNPFFSISLSCPTCSGHKFKAHIKKGPYNTPPNSASRVTTNVVEAQWDLRKIQGPTVDVTVTLCWSSSAEAPVLGSDVAISIWNSNDMTPFWDAGNNFGTKTGSGPFCKTRTFTVNGNQRIFLGVTNDQSPLPITLLSFNGAMNDAGKVNLAWETVDEASNDFFQVQRSANGLDNWEPLGTVKGGGTTSAVTRYTYTDGAPNKDSGYLYYRLKQVDFNGTVDYTAVIRVAVDEALFDKEDIWKVYPNPSHGYDLEMVMTDSRYDSFDNFRFRLTNSAGKELYNEWTSAASGASSIKNQLAFSAAGVYMLEIYTADKVERHRLIKK